MGHRGDEASEAGEDDDLTELRAMLGIAGHEHDEELRAYHTAALRNFEGLAGVRFAGGLQTETLDIRPNGLPFVEVRDLNLEAAEPVLEAGTWAIPDPVSPTFARVLQVSASRGTAPTAAPLWTALRVAAWHVTRGASQGWFVDGVWQWLALERAHGRLEDVLRDAIDPGVHVVVPIGATSVDGWWVQVSRRLQALTRDTPDDPELIEVLGRPASGGAMVAVAPLVVIARLAEQPVTWAMPIRVRVVEGRRQSLAWRMGAAAIRAHGIPVICVDHLTTIEEAAAQLLLAAYWYGYLGRDDTGDMPGALAAAFPKQVASIRSRADAPDTLAAASMLLECLYRRGFDPSCSAETMRHYVARLAASIVRAHRQRLRVDPPWETLGISEGYWYKRLRALGVPKGRDGRFVVTAEHVATIRADLGARDDAHARREAAIAYLMGRGFKEPAARKWLQRHEVADIRSAAPRGGSRD